MNDMITICKTTYTRVVRTRSLYVLLAAVLVLVGAAHLYNDLSAGRQRELMYDAGGALLTIVGLLTALMVNFDIASDLRERVVITLLSKPLGRSQYLLGKFLGVVWLMTINLLILTVGILCLLRWEHGIWRWDFIQLFITTWSSMVMVTALGVTFASFLSELPAALLTVIVFVFGHMTEVLYQTKSGVSYLVFTILPGFGLLDYKTELGNNLTIAWSLVGLSMLYAFCYSSVLLSIANIFFHKRDLA